MHSILGEICSVFAVFSWPLVLVFLQKLLWPNVFCRSIGGHEMQYRPSVFFLTFGAFFGSMAFFFRDAACSRWGWGAFSSIVFS